MAILMKLPYFLLRFLPIWSYICPRCKRKVKRNSNRCPHCGEIYEKPLKIPPMFLKNKEMLEKYVHKHIFPRISAKQREYLAQFFTELFSDGFESGDFSAWDGTKTSGNSTINVSSVESHHGSYSVKINFDAFADDCCAYKSLGQTYNVIHARIYLKITSFNGYLSSRYLGVLEIWEGAIPFAGVALTGNRALKLFYRDGATLYSKTSTTILDLNNWYCIELEVDKNEGIYRVYLDGSEVTDLTASATPSYAANKVSIGKDAWGLGTADETEATIYIDCVVVADTYVGTEASVTEIQISDSAVGQETFSRPRREIPLLEPALGQEILHKIRNLKTFDIATSLETIQKARQMGMITDTAKGLEEMLKQRLMSLLDQASGAEMVARPTRVVVMADEALGQEILDKLREVATITDSAIGIEYISTGPSGEPTKTKIFLFIGDLAIQITGD